MTSVPPDGRAILRQPAAAPVLRHQPQMLGTGLRSLSHNSSSNGLLPGKPVPVTGYVIGKTPRLDNLDHQYGVQVIAPTY